MTDKDQFQSTQLNQEPPVVWAFNSPQESEVKEMLYNSLLSGKSRFGWSGRDEHNLKLENNWTSHHARQMFLRQIRPGDWIVHVNVPSWGKCTAAHVIREYDFDLGLECPWGTDFRHFLTVDIERIVTFNRNDANILSSVNLAPRRRYHRVHAVRDFLASLDNLKTGAVESSDSETAQEYHIQRKTDEYLGQITHLIHQMNRGKQLERFMAKVFRAVPGVIDVVENGFGWRSDHGADLIVTINSSFANLEFENRVIVQVKSFSGKHWESKAVQQVEKGIQMYEANAGLIVTTAKKTEQLEAAAIKAANQQDCPIDILAGDDIARFVIANAPEMVFDLKPLA